MHEIQTITMWPEVNLERDHMSYINCLAWQATVRVTPRDRRAARNPPELFDVHGLTPRSVSWSLLTCKFSHIPAILLCHLFDVFDCLLCMRHQIENIASNIVIERYNSPIFNVNQNINCNVFRSSQSASSRSIGSDYILSNFERPLWACIHLLQCI